MLHSSSSWGTCYEKLLLGMPCSRCLENIMPTFEVGSRKHNKKNEGRVRTTFVYICTRTKGARVRPTSRAYGDAEPCLVCPTATAAAVTARKAHCCCRCRTSVQVKLWWHLLRKSSFGWTKHVKCRVFVLNLFLC